MAKRRQPKLVPLECYGPPVPAPRLTLLRRVPDTFTVAEPCPGNNYWLVGLLNEHMSVEYRSDYVVEVPAKSKLPPWTPQDLAIAAAKRLNEYRGWVSLQRFEDGVCAFAAMFASNSMWTFCVWSTDPASCPPVRPFPEGWRPGEDFPPGIPRREGDALAACHHPERDPVKFSKLAQKMFQ